MSNQRPQLIDTDVHISMKELNDLLPFLPKTWHAQWLASGIAFSGYYSTVGVTRKDAAPPSGGKAGSDPYYLLEHHVEKCDIDYAILTGSANILGVSIHPDIDYGNDIASAYNDWMVEKWLTVSPKFKGSIVINASDPGAAVKEIKRMAGHPDMVQVIMSSASRMLYGQRFYHSIYEEAERCGLPVAIHPGTEGKSVAGPPTPAGYPSRYLEYHNIIPATYMSHVNSLVTEGVFEKFPHFTFVALEGGIAWLPHLMWRMDKNFKGLRDSVPWLKMMPSEYIKRNIRLSTQPIEEPENPQHLRQIFEMAAAGDMAMYSSDYPHWDYDHPKIALATLPKGMRENIKAKNAMELYKLTEKAADSESPPLTLGGKNNG